MASLIHLLLAAISIVLASLTISTDAYAYGTASITYSQKPKSSDTNPKPTVQKPKVDHEKPKVDTAPSSQYTDQDSEGQKIKADSPWQKLEPIFDKTKPRSVELYKTIGIQGIIYCKSGAKLLPVQGATTRITCWAMDKTGYESHLYTTFSKTTDKKGYFLATLPISELQRNTKLFKCSAFLDKSPLESCNVPTDVNKGLSGAIPNPAFHLLPDKEMKLYTVGPFIYTSTKPKYIDQGY